MELREFGWKIIAWPLVLKKIKPMTKTMEDLEKLKPEELDKLFRDQLRKLNTQTSRIPAYTEIVFQLMRLFPSDRIMLLHAILSWLERYPDMEFVGLDIDERDFPVLSLKAHLKVKYRCQDCQKEVTADSYPKLHPGKFRLDIAPEDKEPHLVCSDCYYRDYYEPDYEPEPDWDEMELERQLEEEQEEQEWKAGAYPIDDIPEIDENGDQYKGK